MLEYLLRLALMVPLIGSMAWGSLWLWRKTQLGIGARNDQRVLEITDAAMIGAGCKLAVVRYRDRELLIAVNRTQTVLLAEQSADTPDV
jgi:flagellar protein FliO/FliZ